jgi:hypothetical protein
MRGTNALCRTAGLTLMLTLLAHGSAAADLLEIDCNSGVPGADMIHIWIDTQKSFVTMQQTMPVGLPGYHGSYRVDITPTSFDWAINSLDGVTTASIDRTTGQLHLLQYGGANLNAVYPCTKGSAPFPATKF